MKAAWAGAPGLRYRLYSDTRKDGAFETIASRTRGNTIRIFPPAGPFVLYRVSADNCCAEGPK